MEYHDTLQRAKEAGDRGEVTSGIVAVAFISVCGLAPPSPDVDDTRGDEQAPAAPPLGIPIN
eukprot:3333394-Prorocentrum_lima.AAC.1